jgi:8-oxo-dGTP pyrophosphatase MutT (NUDIX family)
MTTRAAGILFVTPDDRALFLKRGPGGDWPGAWCFPGGKSEGGETAEDTAERETIEELGFLPDGDRIPWTRRLSTNANAEPAGEMINPVPAIGDAVDYTTFIQRVPERFDPKLNGEHTGFAWAALDTPPEPLHPGARIALQRFGMNELDIARAMAAGELTSPQKYMNVWLFAIRITGTGLSYRSSVKEYVWRDSNIYLNDDFLARCNGLAVIIEHPKGALNTKEYKSRSVGAVMLPYISGEEVWGIAKIYDANAAYVMETEQLSTSPMVVLGGQEDSKVTLESGKPLLIEGEAALLDHIAIVPNGVWDKGGEPTGVLSQAIGDTVMADDDKDKAREDAARRDADSGKIDKLLSHLDAMTKRMDAMEEADKARRDAEEKREHADAQHRRDAEREEWHKADAEGCERDDAEEAGEREKMEKEGEAKEVAADKARRARKDRMQARKDAAESSEAKREREDKARRDAEERARKDAEEADKRARADAVLADTRSLAERLAQMPMPPSSADYAAMADAQASFDPVFRAFGDAAPPPMNGEVPLGYRRRLARMLQKHSPAWKAADLVKLDENVLAIAEQQIRADAVVASRSADDVADGVLVPVTRVDGDTGHRVTEFRGRTTIFKQFAPPTMRVTKFITEQRRA